MYKFRMNKFTNKIFIIVTLMAGYMPTSIAAIKCWENDKKIRECSFTVPKKYLGREIQIINNKGQVIQTIPADKTPAQKKKDAELAKIAADKKRVIDERRRRDRILINTFISIDDIILSRDAKSNAIDSIINITESNRAKQQKILDRQTKNAGNFERKSNKVPENIVKDIKSSKDKIKEYNDFIETKKQEKLSLHQKYDSDIKRFKELKAIKPR